MSQDLFIYRIIENSGYNRRFRRRHEDRFERNIQLVLHEFAQMKESIHYFEKYLAGNFMGLTSVGFCDKVGNVICHKDLKENDFKRDQKK